MHITVIGTGYVGLVVGACLAESGNIVVCADVDESKIESLRKNVLPIFEPSLESIVARNQMEGRLTFTSDISLAIACAEVVFIAVGTPPDEDGSADLRHVLSVADTIGHSMRRELVVVTKSTVPVGTAARVADVISRHAQYAFHLVSNPEFLKEGAALDDFMRPDRVVVGVETNYARDIMTKLYAPYMRAGHPILFMDIRSAELTKYAANAMLAARISFMNEIAGLCELVGADVDRVREGIGSDTRIGAEFLRPGPGYGGSCFPKDVKALLRTAHEYFAPLSVLSAVDKANERQKGVLFRKLRNALGGEVKGARVALWGLAFKPQTDDMREAPSLVLIDDLLEAGARVIAHDPVAMPQARVRLRDRVQFADSRYDAVERADALVIVTDWDEYRTPDFHRLRAALARPIVVDGRNLYDPATMSSLGFDYHSIGRGVPCVSSSPVQPASSGHTSPIASWPTGTRSSASTAS